MLVLWLWSMPGLADLGEKTERPSQGHEERAMAERWRRCSACKSDIGLGSVYWVCSVSTCNRSRTALFFCSVDCWEIHLPTERHREAWAIEERAPSVPDPPESTPRPRKPRASPGGASAASGGGEILIVASRLKAYIRHRAGYNTSDNVLAVLSDAIRKICDEAIRNARHAERQTVLERDVPRDQCGGSI